MRRAAHRRQLLGMALFLTIGLTLSTAAQASWVGGGSGQASALAYVMPSGSQPTARVSGASVSLRWPAAVFPNNQSVAGYTVRRFDATNGAPATVGAGCAGTVTTTTCTELNVPSGTWIYTDTPTQHNWTGGQSSASASVTVP
jgi:hypothetical protein